MKHNSSSIFVKLSIIGNIPSFDMDDLTIQYASTTQIIASAPGITLVKWPRRTTVKGKLCVFQ